MRCQFFFAHPDDEVVSSAGLIDALTAAGHAVQVVFVSKGEAGEVSSEALSDLHAHGSVGALRELEVQAAAELLGYEPVFLDFGDGTIQNAHVWGELARAVQSQIEAYRPELLVTFDQTGWYFHLDHIGTSLSCSIALHQSSYEPAAYFHVHYRPHLEAHFPYVFRTPFPPELPNLYTLTLEDSTKKRAAIEAHVSQSLDVPLAHLDREQPHHEWYECVRRADDSQAIFTELARLGFVHWQG